MPSRPAVSLSGLALEEEHHPAMLLHLAGCPILIDSFIVDEDGHRLRKQTTFFPSPHPLRKQTTTLSRPSLAEGHTFRCAAPTTRHNRLPERPPAGRSAKDIRLHVLILIDSPIVDGGGHRLRKQTTISTPPPVENLSSDFSYFPPVTHSIQTISPKRKMSLSLSAPTYTGSRDQIRRGSATRGASLCIQP